MSGSVGGWGQQRPWSTRPREGGEPRQEPRFGHRLDRDDPHPPGPAALAFRDAVVLGEDALHLLGTVTGLRHDGG